MDMCKHYDATTKECVQYIKQCDKNPKDNYSCYLFECCVSFGENEQKNDIRGCLLESEKKCSIGNEAVYKEY